IDELVLVPVSERDAVAFHVMSPFFIHPCQPQPAYFSASFWGLCARQFIDGVSVGDSLLPSHLHVWPLLVV
ncbi:MAG: hypothetical protein NUV34_03110, partial [Sulfuricaulis sp.]|nr:hypothetical protein [Sulfuricaulis sp.]